MNIYTKKNYPYVYRLDNLITNEFYIGYRKANLFPAEKDLGTKYFTSAPAITERFNEFQITIIAEFFTDTASNDAYDHEQYLIYCDLGNPLMLNKKCYYGKRRFNTTGIARSDKTKEKCKQTNLEKYGVENTFQDPLIKEKCKQTNLEKYGVEYSLQSLIVKEQIEHTNLERYGVSNPFQSPIIQEKLKQTNLERYGVKYAIQNPSVQQKGAITRRNSLVKLFKCESESEIIEKIFYYEKLYNIKRRYINNPTPNLTEILKYFPLTAHKSIKGLRSIYNNHISKDL